MTMHCKAVPLLLFIVFVFAFTIGTVDAAKKVLSGTIIRNTDAYWRVDPSWSQYIPYPIPLSIANGNQFYPGCFQANFSVQNTGNVAIDDLEIFKPGTVVPASGNQVWSFDYEAMNLNGALNSTGYKNYSWRYDPLFAYPAGWTVNYQKQGDPISAFDVEDKQNLSLGFIVHWHANTGFEIQPGQTLSGFKTCLISRPSVYGYNTLNLVWYLHTPVLHTSPNIISGTTTINCPPHDGNTKCSSLDRLQHYPNWGKWEYNTYRTSGYCWVTPPTPVGCPGSELNKLPPPRDPYWPPLEPWA